LLLDGFRPEEVGPQPQNVKALGIEFPTGLLVRADEVIE
jgi:hypothetical protein